MKVNNCLSVSKSIQAGVPQGSILGPLLFNVYFNSIAYEILANKYANIALYADDLASWVISPYLHIINKQLQLICDKILKWMRKWRMLVSLSKTVVSLFNRANKNRSKEIEVYYNGTRLNTDNNPKFLGITLDPGLHFHKNTEIIVNRAKNRLKMLRKLKGTSWGVSSSLIITTYKILIRSLIDYAALTIPLLSKTSLNKLESIQRNAIRIAYRCPPNTSCEELLQISCLESIESRSIQQANKFLTKSIRYDNQNVRKQIENYAKYPDIQEGAISNKAPKTTLLGNLLNNDSSKMNLITISLLISDLNHQS